MRYQERIYIQNENSGVRNKDILNVNMSSDMCIFESPLFNLSGGSKINCTGITQTYVITSATTIPLVFDFTANTETFINTNASFKYEIYKFNNEIKAFTLPPIYSSNVIQYSAISATSSTIQEINLTDISLDGDYLVKGFYEYDVCTNFMNKLNKRIDTLTYRSGTKFGLYDDKLDYYFTAINSAEIPKLATNSSNTPSANQLHQQVILPKDGQTNIIISNSYSGFFVLTLNGLVLANRYDYTYSGNVITLNEKCVGDDIITIFYTTTGGNNLVGDNILVNTVIVSGTSNNESNNITYFNTTTGKYEIYTSISPAKNGDILVMINGATLANGIDYYQSISNPKRIILEGNIILNDMITIVYFPTTNVVNGLYTNKPVITWMLEKGPQKANGFFSLEVSTEKSFESIYYSGYTQYIPDKTVYSDTFIASGDVGSNLYYRIKNEKQYITLCSNIITTIAYSEIIPLTIQTNSINSY